MHVDDRLATVLSAHAESVVARRIQYRQLVDLLGTTPAGARGEQLDAALVRLAELAKQVPADERAKAISGSGTRLRNPRLVAELAAGDTVVALAAIRAARLAEHDWLDLIPALPLAARGLLRTRRDLGAVVEARLDQLGITDRALPAAPIPQSTDATELTAPLATPDPDPTPAPAPAAEAAAISAPIEGIGAIVRRIEAFRRNREQAGDLHAANDSPRLPLGERDAAFSRIAAFSFATDSAGRIGWAEPHVGGMAIGLLLPVGSTVQTDGAGADLSEAFMRRLPIRAGRITLEGAPAIAGEWQVDAAPDFDDAGHFTGYVGRFRRPAPPRASRGNLEADRIRQVLHELRTPVNAIQGFAEVIQQQLFGTTPHEYRALAAGIAADAARMLAGFEELDRYARLDSGSLSAERGSAELAMMVAGIVHQLETFTAARSSGFTLDAAAGEMAVALAPEAAEQLGWRLLATLAANARPGEILALSLAPADTSAAGTGAAVRLIAQLPEALAAQDDVFEAAPPQTGQALSAGMFGSGFTLRLAAAEARSVGGLLAREGANLILCLPCAEAPEPSANTCLPIDDNTVASAAG